MDMLTPQTSTHVQLGLILGKLNGDDFDSPSLHHCLAAMNVREACWQ